MAISANLGSDGFSSKDSSYGNRNSEQLVPAVVACASREKKQGTYGPGHPARPLEVKILRRQPQNIFTRCRSASESVFPGIQEQIFRGFIDSKNVFTDAEVLKI